MYLKRFRSTSVRDALRVARRELGPEALVLSTELVGAAGWRGWMGRRDVEITAAAEREEQSDSRQARTDPRQAGKGHTEEVIARLTASGLEPELAGEIAAGMSPASRRGAAVFDLRKALAERLSTLAACDATYAPVEVFVGPPGVGKTTTIAKIAAQERARRGRRLGLVAADGFRIGAVEQLRLYAEIIGAPFKVARSGAELERALSIPHRQPILVDTAGRVPSDDAARDLFRVLACRSDVRTHLVMAAGTAVSSARRILDAYRDARPTRLILTKVDEAESLSPLVGLLRQYQLPISYLGNGQRVPEDLNRATAQLLAASVVGDTASALSIHS